MAKHRTVGTTLQCIECGFLFPIQRKQGKQKSVGHIKHLYCPCCKVTQAFFEMKEVDQASQFWITYHLERELEQVNRELEMIIPQEGSR